MSYVSRATESSGLYTNLPGLISFWPVGTTNLSGDAVDLTGNGNLTNTTSTPYKFDKITYLDFDGLDYLTHTADGTYDITGTETHIDPSLQGLTVGAWVWLENIASPASIISKWNISIAQKSYSLDFTTLKELEFSISDDGTAIETVLSASTTLNGVWVFCVGRFSPNVLDVFFNTEITTLPATATSIFQSTSDLIIGTKLPIFSSGFLDGRIKNLFISSAAIPDSEILKLYDNTKILFV